MKRCLATFILLFSFTVCFCQAPDCNQGLIYVLSGGSILNFDPTLPQSGTNPTTNTITGIPGGCLAVGPNINGGATSPTFYSVSGNFWYWDAGTNSWINTGHSAGPGVNIGAGGGYIYNLIGSSGQVWKYDGTGPATLLVTVATFSGGGPYDIVCDCVGNFYLLNNTLHTLEKYNPQGVLIATYTTNSVTSSAGGGFAIIGNNIYYDSNGFYAGVINQSNGTVSFTQTAATSLAPSDYASCPINTPIPILVSEDTIYKCSGAAGSNVTVSPAGSNYYWTVATGDAIINGNSDNVLLSANTSSIVVVHDTTQVCGDATDTVQIIVPTGSIDAGADIIVACTDNTPQTLNATYSNLTNNITYTVSWTPTASIQSGDTTLHPIAQTTDNGSYTVTLQTNAAQGGCKFTDDVTITRATGCGNITFPTAFTPNGDLLNDWFRAVGATDNISAFHLQVYNRWGELVYESNDVKAGWDGKQKGSIAAIDSYPWVATYTAKDTGKVSTTIGNVTLLK